jgi:hypothetical protein
MSSIRAKFKVTSIERTEQGSGYRGGRWVDDGTVEKRTIKMRPVYSDVPGSENKAFWDASPDGSLELSVINQDAWKHFELGKEYYLDFTLANG